jgi:hypothetical protein
VKSRFGVAQIEKAMGLGEKRVVDAGGWELTSRRSLKLFTPGLVAGVTPLLALDWLEKAGSYPHGDWVGAAEYSDRMESAMMAGIRTVF